jgi:hypothetical protein
MIAADVEELVVTYLSQFFSNVSVDMPSRPPLPFYLVTRLAGADDMITDCATVSVHAFAADMTAASDAARALHLKMNPWALTAKQGFDLNSGRAFIDRICTVETPAWRNYEDPNLKRYCGRYRIELRMNQSS